MTADFDGPMESLIDGISDLWPVTNKTAAFPDFVFRMYLLYKLKVGMLVYV